MIVLTGALVQVFAHYQLRRLMGIDRMHSEIDRLTGHTIICGLGRIGHQLAKELALARSPFVIVERDAVKLTEAQAMGYLCLTGDATDEDALREAGIERARVLATVLPDDAANVFITLSRAQSQCTAGDHRARRGTFHRGQAHPCRRGSGRAAHPTSAPSASPSSSSIPQQPVSWRNRRGLLEMRRSLREFGLEVEVVNVPARGALTGRTVAEGASSGAAAPSSSSRSSGLAAPASANPGENVRIQADDKLVLIMRGKQGLGGRHLLRARAADADRPELSQIGVTILVFRRIDKPTPHRRAPSSPRPPP